MMNTLIDTIITLTWKQHHSTNFRQWKKQLPVLIALYYLLVTPCAASEAPAEVAVGITAELPVVEVVHQERRVQIKREQNQQNTINPRYTLTSRPCPPFCIQPMTIATGVETIAELEVLQYLQRITAGDNTVLVIDSRTPDWLVHGTIPGSINIPWKQLKVASGADPFTIADILEQRFSVRNVEGLWDFSAAKTLILFCNGPWCGQSPSNINTLLRLGYPASKLKWYRGGMQSWESLGLTVVR